MKKSVFLTVFIGIFTSLSAVEYHDYVNFKLIDKDQDFKIETAELRKWSESYARIWAYNQTMAKEAFPAGDFFMTKADKDNDRTISKIELRDFQLIVKPLFEKAYEELKSTFDVNENGRMDKSELTEAFIKYPNFVAYFNKNAKKLLAGAPELADAMNRGPGQEFRRPVEKRQKRKLDDIYD